MSFVYAVLGLFLLLLTVVDALWTTLWVDGSAGPLASRISTWSWRGLLSAVGRRRHGALSLFGPFILMAVVLMWVLLLWAGWVLVFAADPTSLVGAHSGEPADWTDRIYFVAYSMFTMGNGDFSPQDGGWQVVASLTTGTGMLLVTLGITYVLSVLGAVVQKRGFASQVTGLGTTPEELLAESWDGRSFATLDLPLSALSSELCQLSARYRAYPVLQYYHAAQPAKSPIVALVILDEALTLLRFGVPEDARPNRAVLRSARASVSSFLDTLPSAFIHAAPEAPADPDTSALASAGIPLESDAALRRALEEQRERRRRLLGLLRNDGWNWLEWRS